MTLACVKLTQVPAMAIICVSFWLCKNSALAAHSLSKKTYPVSAIRAYTELSTVCPALCAHHDPYKFWSELLALALKRLILFGEQNSLVKLLILHGVCAVSLARMAPRMSSWLAQR